MSSYREMTQVPSYVPNDGLVAWYEFDNNVADASDNAHNGSVYGASFVESPLNGAVSFDGSDDYLEIPTSPVFEDMVHELTLSAWFKKTNSNTGTIVAKRNFVGNPCGERHHFELTCMPDNSVFFSASHNCIELNNTQVQSAPDVFQLNEWTHVAVTYDNGVLLMYVNGELVLEHDEGYRELLPNNHWINFGRIHRSGGNPFFNEYAGEIDESGIWNRVLLPMEIQSLYEGIENPAISGCMDETACNYNSEATEDDGGCFYLTLPDTIAASPETPLNLNLDFSNQCRETSSASFDGQSPSSGLGDNVTLPSSLLAGAQSWSMIYSFTLADDGRHTLLCKHSSGENTYSTLGIGYYVAGNGHPNNTNNRLSFHASNGQSNALSNAVLEAGHHVVGLSYLNGILSIWIDGALDSQHNGNFSLTGDQSYSAYTIGRLFYSYDSYRLRGDLHWAGFLNMGLDNAGMQNWMDCPKAEEYNQSVLYFGGQVADGVVPNYNSPGTMDGIAEGLDVIPSSADGIEVAWTGNGTDSWTGNMPATDSEWTIHILQDGDTLCSQTIWFDALIEGCTDESACNYSPEADVENGSCEFPGCQDSQACNYMTSDICDDACVYPLVGEDCEAGAVACAEGTVWDAESQTCVVAIPAYLNEPGEAAILNPCYFDSNGNGLVEVTDLMNVLSVYGLACGEIPEAAEFSCGDPLNYQGYDYETVLIGDQCWFAENLRSTNYRNGDEIDTDLSLEDWSALNAGATSVYGEGESACNDDSPVIDSCDDALALLAFGRLYNGAAITDSRQLCPAGWGVPTDMAWTQLTDFLGGLASAGDALKSTENWYGGGNGTNDSGFDGEPGGYRNFLSEQFYNGGSSGYWWSQSPSGASELFIRSIDWNGNGSINVQSRSVQNSYSVRCLKSVE